MSIVRRITSALLGLLFLAALASPAVFAQSPAPLLTLRLSVTPDDDVGPHLMSARRGA